MNDNQNSFLDSNTLLAIAISFLVFIGWQTYMSKKYPPKKPGDKTVVTQEKTGPVEKETSVTVSEAVENSGETSSPSKASVEEQLYTFQSSNFSFQLSNIGMGLKDIKLQNYTDRKDNFIVFGDTKKIAEKIVALKEKGAALNSTEVEQIKKYRNFSTLFQGEPLIFNIQRVSDSEFVGTANFSKGKVTKKMVFNEAQFSADVQVDVEWNEGSSKSGIQTFLFDNEMVKEKFALSFLIPSYEGSRYFFNAEGSEERGMIDPGSAVSEEFKQVDLTSMGSQYFIVGLLDGSKVLPDGQFNYQPKYGLMTATINHKPINESKTFSQAYTLFMGPRSYDVLAGVNDKFTNVIDYGIFSFLSKPILGLLKWLYAIFQNWGIAIILLTVIIRLILLPINISSFKSMKKMQLIQPEIKRIREKFKDDPQRLNQETMALMKREKANPIGGCLPMLAQLPVFFALYTVLGMSIELYKSPFAFWIQDLSYRDPYYILPIAVGILFFLQHKLTPTTMDPAQAKIMKMIPIIFSVFMMGMPSGLLLYFFVNTVFGIGQQYWIHKDKKEVATKKAEAPA